MKSNIGFIMKKKAAIIGSFVVDLMARTPHLPEPGETVKGSFFRLGPGGKGYNQTVAAVKAGGDIFFSTKVGMDSFSDILFSSMDKYGVSNRLIFSSDDASTGIALISVDETSSQNEIVVVSGACDTITESEVLNIFSLMGDVEYLLLQLEINIEAIELIVSMAYERGIKVILNPAPIQILSNDLYSKLYAITPNEVEAQILTSMKYGSISDCRNMASFFHTEGVENVVITLGKNGAYVSTDGTEYELANYNDIIVKDTTGAGDAFNGGLVAALSKGYSFIDASNYANVVSNLSVAKIGTAPSMPSHEEIEMFMETHIPVCRKIECPR